MVVIQGAIKLWFGALGWYDLFIYPNFVMHKKKYRLTSFAIQISSDHCLRFEFN
jgi:hypothetical protein